MSEPAAAPAPDAFRRQHPLSWIFEAFTVLKSAVLPMIVFLVFSQGLAIGWLALLLVVPATVLGIARHLALSYSIGRGELIVRDGILSRSERRVRFSRIHNVDEVQGLLHRLVGAVLVKVETASGGKPEATLHLAPAAAAELRAGVFAKRDEGEAESEEGEALVRVPLADLVRLGLIQNRGFVVVAAILGLFFQFDFGFGDLDDRLEELLPTVFEGGAEQLVPGALEGGVQQLAAGWLRVVAGGAAVLIGAWLLLSTLSIALAIVRFYGFTLVRRGDDLVARYGLLNRFQVTVPRRRIQRLRVEESALHRLFRRLGVRLDTAGGQSGAQPDSPFGNDGEGPARGTQWLAPVTRGERLRSLIAAAFPKAALEPLAEPVGTGGWRPFPRRAVYRLFRKSSLVVLLPTLGLYSLTPWSLLLPLLLPLLFLVCRKVIASRFWRTTDDALWWRSGWPGRQLTVLPFDKIQLVEIIQSPFDRRARMARLSIDTAGSGVRRGAYITYLEDGDATALAERLAKESGRREFVWG